MKILVLLPNSYFLPHVSKQILGGVNAAIKSGDLKFDVKYEMTGFTADLNSLQEKIQKALLEHQPDVVIGPMGMQIQGEIKTIFESFETPFINLDLGAHILKEDSLSDFIYINSFDYWGCQWAGGFYSVNKWGKNIGVSTAFHEAGYEFSYAYTLGAEAAGANLQQVIVTHKNSNTEVPVEDLQKMFENELDVFAVFYSGKEADYFWKALNEFDLNSKQISLYMHSAMSQRLRHNNNNIDNLEGIKYFTTWSETMDNNENKKFLEKYYQNEKVGPCEYSILAYEAIQFINSAAKDNSAKLVDSLSKVEINGPRGTLFFNKDRITEADKFQVELVNKNGNIIEQINDSFMYDESYAKKRSELRTSLSVGWLNPYLIG